MPRECTISESKADQIGLRGWSVELDQQCDNRIYRSHTVDAVLEDSASKVTCETAVQFTTAPDVPVELFRQLRIERPFLTWVADRWGGDGNALSIITALAHFTCHEMPHVFPSPQHNACNGCYTTPDDFIWGGTEEFVIVKGSDWCVEVARVFCALTQMRSIPSRIIYTFSQTDGHVITECFIDGAWVLVDPLAPKVYLTDDGEYISIARMSLATVEERTRWTAGHEGCYVHPDFFQFLAVSTYNLWEAVRYNYELSYCNDFYRERLKAVWQAFC